MSYSLFNSSIIHAIASIIESFFCQSRKKNDRKINFFNLNKFAKSSFTKKLEMKWVNHVFWKIPRQKLSKIRKTHQPQIICQDHDNCFCATTKLHFERVLAPTRAVVRRVTALEKSSWFCKINSFFASRWKVSFEPAKVFSLLNLNRKH